MRIQTAEIRVYKPRHGHYDHAPDARFCGVCGSRLFFGQCRHQIATN